jgi:hypothetical protein
MPPLISGALQMRGQLKLHNEHLLVVYIDLAYGYNPHFIKTFPLGKLYGAIPSQQTIV